MRKFFLAAVFVLMAGGAQSATLNVIGGILHGASGVDVGGTIYDVAFVEGTCIELFSGCDDPTDFSFDSQNSATAASQALLSQVFLDVSSLGAFDSQPNDTWGCPSGMPCVALTPYASSGGSVYAKGAYNSHTDSGDGTDRHSLFFITFDVSRTTALFVPNQISHAYVYAVWSAEPIPEPSTALLLGLGLVGMAARRRV